MTAELDAGGVDRAAARARADGGRAAGADRAGASAHQRAGGGARAAGAPALRAGAVARGRSGLGDRWGGRGGRQRGRVPAARRAQPARDADAEPRDDVRADLDAKADSRQTWGAVTTAAGVAVLAVGIVKLAITPGTPRTPDRGGRVAGDQPGAVALGGTF
jgi:hypothetical protein